MNLDGGFGEASPSHSAQAVTAFPGAEDFLDAPADTVDRSVPGSEAIERFGLVSPPHAGRDNAWRASFGPNRVAEVISPIGAVGEHLAWIIGQGVGSGAPIVDVGRRAFLLATATVAR